MIAEKIDRPVRTAGRKSTASPIRVLVADDHAIIRAGVRKVLADQPDIVIAGEASDGQEVLQQLRYNEYDLLLLDLYMPGRSGIELLKQVNNQYPRLAVLILSSHREDEYAVRVLRAGAVGYVTKESAPQVLVPAIRKVVGGGRYISPFLAEKLLLEWGEAEKRPLHSALSDREYQVLVMIASGKNASTIANELALSVKTVGTHKLRLQQKLGIRNITELVQYALKNQLVDPHDGPFAGSS